METSVNYKDKLVELVTNADAKEQKMLYGIISNLLAAEDYRVLDVFERLIKSIIKKGE